MTFKDLWDGKSRKGKSHNGIFQRLWIIRQALQTIGRGFNAETIEIIQNTYMDQSILFGYGYRFNTDSL